LHKAPNALDYARLESISWKQRKTKFLQEGAVPGGRLEGLLLDLGALNLGFCQLDPPRHAPLAQAGIAMHKINQTQDTAIRP